MGPNDPIPIAAKPSPAFSRKKLMAFPIVSLGDAVGNEVTTRSSGHVPMPQMNFVPPASMPPNSFMVTLYFCRHLRPAVPGSGNDRIEDGCAQSSTATDESTITD
jgi:hypothetical protein